LAAKPSDFRRAGRFSIVSIGKQLYGSHPAPSEPDKRNFFNVLMDAVRCCSLGQITNALFEVGGQYRRSM
jgi:methylmalonyl-CoA mutase N-terminal domain/subunit